MANFSLHQLNDADYEDARYNFLLQTEENGNPKEVAYLDSKQIPTIGIGFNMRANFDVIADKIMYPDGRPFIIPAADITYRAQLRTQINGRKWE